MSGMVEGGLPETAEHRLARLTRNAAREFVKDCASPELHSSRLVLSTLLEASGHDATSCAAFRGEIKDAGEARRRLRDLGVFPHAKPEDFEPDHLRELLDGHLELPNE